MEEIHETSKNSKIKHFKVALLTDFWVIWSNFNRSQPLDTYNIWDSHSLVYILYGVWGIWSRGVSALGVCSRGSAPMGVWSRGCLLQGRGSGLGVLLSHHALRQTPHEQND